MNHKDTIALINQAYEALSVLNDIDTTNYRDELCAMRMKDERRHRAANSNATNSYLCTVRDAARMFVVRDLSNWSKADSMRAADMLGMAPAYQQAAMVASRYMYHVAHALAGFNIDQLRKLDYVALVNARNQEFKS